VVAFLCRLPSLHRQRTAACPSPDQPRSDPSRQTYSRWWLRNGCSKLRPRDDDFYKLKHFSVPKEFEQTYSVWELEIKLPDLKSSLMTWCMTFQESFSLCKVDNLGQSNTMSSNSIWSPRQIYFAQIISAQHI
jgi:hypothetical protein